MYDCSQGVRRHCYTVFTPPGVSREQLTSHCSSVGHTEASWGSFLRINSPLWANSNISWWFIRERNWHLFGWCLRYFQICRENESKLQVIRWFCVFSVLSSESSHLTRPGITLRSQLSWIFLRELWNCFFYTTRELTVSITHWWRLSVTLLMLYV